MAEVTEHSSRGTKAAQRDRSRALLITVATERFARDGYHATALEGLVADAGLTRGALYHHFASKIGLFEAVLQSALESVAEAVEQASDGDAPARTRFLSGCRAFLEASVDPAVRRILLVDGPIVLGWDAWRDGDSATSARLLDVGLQELVDAGDVDERDLAAVSAMLSGALNEVALSLGDRSEPEPEIDAAMRVLERFLGGLAAPERPVE